MSPEAVVQARERERQVLQLFLRGLHWVEIGRQLGMTDMGAIKAFDRATKRIPTKDAEMLRKLQSERLNDARRRVYSEFAGRPSRCRTRRTRVRRKPSRFGRPLSRFMPASIG
jgi:hypothetical protein